MVNLTAERFMELYSESEGVPARILSKARNVIGATAHHEERRWPQFAGRARLRNVLIGAAVITVATLA